MNIYGKFAQVYDQMGSDRFSVRMFHYTQRLLSRRRYRPRSVLDLACGTGSAAVLWAQKGIEVFGIDVSADMLTVAEAKAREEKVRVEFSCQPMTSFALDRPVDLVTCYFDSLNYLLTRQELVSSFCSVRNALRGGGYFVFDVNTPEAMKVLWGAEVYADAQKDIAWVWKNCYYQQARQAEVRATFFARRGKIWERFDEIHCERGYTATEIRAALRAADFKNIDIYECLKFTRPKRDSLRIAVVAQKPG